MAELDLRVKLARESARETDLAHRLAAAQQRRIERAKSRLDVLARELGTLRPTSILERGYSIVSTEGGKIVREAGQVTAGDSLSVRLHRGRLEVEVSEATEE